MKQKTPPVKLKFWQKACAVLWGAFLVCLAMVCGAVYFWGKEQSYESELSAHLNDQAAMIQQLAKDVSALESRGSNALPALWQRHHEARFTHQRTQPPRRPVHLRPVRHSGGHARFHEQSAAAFLLGGDAGAEAEVGSQNDEQR